ncbi:MAG: ABC transporter permease, partial [Lachnospiraceae bacterium]|nr:ABC transporter permease [Lachnospiraceae bacterium]
MTENIRLSFKGIWSHKMRSFLTMLGIIIGIASIIVIVSLIQGTNKQIEENLVGDGSHTVNVVLVQDGWEADFNNSNIPEGIPQFGQKTVDTIREMDNVEAVSMYIKADWVNGLYYKNTALTGNHLMGIDEDYLETAGYELIAGRGITNQDMKRFNKICLVEESMVSGVFEGENPIGKTLDINKECFVVAGVIAKKSNFEPVIESISDYMTYKGEESGSIFIPSSVWPVLFRYDVPYSFIVKASATKTMTSVGKEVTEYLNNQLQVMEGNVKYSSQDLAAQAAQLQNLSSSTNFLMIGIAAISLLVGGIGVMNIMLVSVTERTREIGLKKALGAKKRVILGQFLTEAALLSAIGGVLGVILGIILARVIAVVAMVPSAISVPAILISVGFSMMIGMVFGLAPSMKAANLNPIDALRYE